MSVNDPNEAVDLSDLKDDPEEVVERAATTHHAVHLTRQGRVVAVLRAIEDHQAAEEERAFLRAVVEGLADLETGREVLLEKARARLRANPKGSPPKDAPWQAMFEALSTFRGALRLERD